jgi:hypothetical protein
MEVAQRRRHGGGGTEEAEEERAAAVQDADLWGRRPGQVVSMPKP